MPKPKVVTTITVRCAVCDKIHGEYPKDEVPKTFKCKHCYVGQTYKPSVDVGFTPGNNHNGHELPPGGG